MNTDDEVEIVEDNLFKRYCELTILRKSQDKAHTFMFCICISLSYTIHTCSIFSTM